MERRILPLYVVSRVCFVKWVWLSRNAWIVRKNVVVDMMRFKIFSLFIFDSLSTCAKGGLQTTQWLKWNFIECPIPTNQRAYIFINKKSMLKSKANEDELLMSKKRRGKNSFAVDSRDSDLRSLDDERLNYLIALPHWIVASIRAWLEQKRSELMTFYGPLSSHLSYIHFLYCFNM